MTADSMSHTLTRPIAYLARMIVFLLLVGFLALILYRQIQTCLLYTSDAADE